MNSDEGKAKVAGKKQQAQRAEQRAKEAEIRPEALHRAIHFLLQQQMINMPDTTEDARYHMAVLDSQLSADAKTAAADIAETTERPPEEDDPEEPGETEIAAAAGQTADPPALKQSRRFRPR